MECLKTNSPQNAVEGVLNTLDCPNAGVLCPKEKVVCPKAGVAGTSEADEEPKTDVDDPNADELDDPKGDGEVLAPSAGVEPNMEGVADEVDPKGEEPNAGVDVDPKPELPKAGVFGAKLTVQNL
ncbi:unnamed protein product [Ilex paraguariensis]|uniref:Uncharacterized protein n=1 Tax=Ilex paraguariensis TaxID=185542 RepID=A0ABC8T819_9AQUA